MVVQISNSIISKHFFDLHEFLTKKVLYLVYALFSDEMFHGKCFKSDLHVFQFVLNIFLYILLEKNVRTNLFMVWKSNPKNSHPYPKHSFY